MVKLQMTFATGSGASKNFGYNHADKETPASSVKSLMEGMIANGEIFSTPPVAKKSAKFIETTETAINIA